MSDNPTINEEKRLFRLQEARNSETINNPEGEVEETKLSFFKKLTEHWLILSFAGLFDFTIGLIPLLAPFFNFIWGGVLYLKFGGKKLTKTFLTIGLGSIMDFIFSILPVCLAATVVKIINE